MNTSRSSLSCFSSSSNRAHLRASVLAKCTTAGRWLLTLWLGSWLVWKGSAAPIAHEVLDTEKSLTLGIGNRSVTTLQFPRPLQGIFGYGLTTGEAPGTYHYAHPPGSRVLALRNLMPDKETFLTVLMGTEDLYVLHLKPMSDPAVLVRLSEGATTAASLSAVRPVDAESLAKRRLDHSTARLFNLLKLGKNARTFRVAVPHLYEDVESRDVDYRREDGKVATVITKLHRFPKEDAIFVDARIENETDAAIYFDPGSVQVKIGSRTYPTALVDAASEVPAGGKVSLHAIVRGGLEGERVHLSIKNEVQLIMADYAATPDDPALVDALGMVLDPNETIHVEPDGPDMSLFPDPKGVSGSVREGGSK